MPAIPLEIIDGKQWFEEHICGRDYEDRMKQLEAAGVVFEWWEVGNRNSDWNVRYRMPVRNPLVLWLDIVRLRTVPDEGVPF